MSEAQPIVQIVPAQPGYYTLHLSPYNGEIVGWKKFPIVAWRIESGAAIPVSFLSPESERSAILCPDGCVFTKTTMHKTSGDWYHFEKYGRERA